MTVASDQWCYLTCSFVKNKLTSTLGSLVTKSKQLLRVTRAKMLVVKGLLVTFMERLFFEAEKSMFSCSKKVFFFVPEK